jgi:cytochrome c556
MQKLRDSGLAGSLQTLASSCVLKTLMVSCACAKPEKEAKAANAMRNFFMGSPLGVCKNDNKPYTAQIMH